MLFLGAARRSFPPPFTSPQELTWLSFFGLSLVLFPGSKSKERREASSRFRGRADTASTPVAEEGLPQPAQAGIPMAEPLQAVELDKAGKDRSDKADHHEDVAGHRRGGKQDQGRGEVAWGGSRKVQPQDFHRGQQLLRIGSGSHREAGWPSAARLLQQARLEGPDEAVEVRGDTIPGPAATKIEAPLRVRRKASRARHPHYEVTHIYTTTQS